MFYLICAWTNGCANNRDAGDFRRHRAHYGVTVMGHVKLLPFNPEFLLKILFFKGKLHRIYTRENSKCMIFPFRWIECGVPSGGIHSPHYIYSHSHIDGLAQDCSDSIANSQALLQSCSKPSICSIIFIIICNLCCDSISNLVSYVVGYHLKWFATDD